MSYKLPIEASCKNTWVLFFKNVAFSLRFGLSFTSKQIFSSVELLPDFLKTLLYCFHVHRKTGFWGLSVLIDTFLCKMFLFMTSYPQAAANKLQI